MNKYKEFTCPLCTELFITPVSTICGHTFCHYCIALWLENDRTCPLCKLGITEFVHVLALKNFLEETLSNESEEFLQKRTQRVEQHKQFFENKSEMKQEEQRAVLNEYQMSLDDDIFSISSHDEDSLSVILDDMSIASSSAESISTEMALNSTLDDDSSSDWVPPSPIESPTSTWTPLVSSDDGGGEETDPDLSDLVFTHLLHP